MKQFSFSNDFTNVTNNNNTKERCFPTTLTKIDTIDTGMDERFDKLNNDTFENEALLIIQQNMIKKTVLHFLENDEISQQKKLDFTNQYLNDNSKCKYSTNYRAGGLFKDFC